MSKSVRHNNLRARIIAAAAGGVMLVATGSGAIAAAQPGLNTDGASQEESTNTGESNKDTSGGQPGLNTDTPAEKPEEVPSDNQGGGQPGLNTDTPAPTPEPAEPENGGQPGLNTDTPVEEAPEVPKQPAPAPEPAPEPAPAPVQPEQPAQPEQPVTPPATDQGGESNAVNGEGNEYIPVVDAEQPVQVEQPAPVEQPVQVEQPAPEPSPEPQLNEYDQAVADLTATANQISRAANTPPTCDDGFTPACDTANGLNYVATELNQAINPDELVADAAAALEGNATVNQAVVNAAETVNESADAAVEYAQEYGEASNTAISTIDQEVFGGQGTTESFGL